MLSSFSEIPRSASLTSVVTKTKANNERSNNRPQIIAMCIGLAFNQCPAIWLREAGRLWAENGSQYNCWLCTGWIYTGRELKPYSGSKLNGSYSLWAMKSWHHRCDSTPWILGAISPLQRRQNLWQKLLRRGMETNFICVTYTAFETKECTTSLFGSKIRSRWQVVPVSFNICELSAQPVCVNISCYYPDFNLPCPLL